MAVLLLTACSQDSGESESGGMLQIASCLTRSLPVTPTEDVAIELYMTTGTEARRGSFTYQTLTGQWENSNVRAETGTSYYIYGMMPAKDSYTTTISPSSGGYVNGASLTVSGLSPVMTESPCYIAGVRGGTDVETTADIAEWNYLYVGQDEGQNQVNLLMDHIYAAISLKITIGYDYAVLRNIKLKKMQLRTSSTNKIRVNITQHQGLAPLFDYTSLTETAVIPDLIDSSEGIMLSTDTPLTVETYVAPSLTALTLVSTYDVYDKEGHRIRKDETAENDITAVVIRRQGVKTILNMTVAPSYLNVLGDPDALNPTVVREK